MQAALKDAQQAMIDRDAALKAGDLTKFAEADARLTAAVQKLLALNGDTTGGADRVAHRPDGRVGGAMGSVRRRRAQELSHHHQIRSSVCREAGELVQPEEAVPPARGGGGLGIRHGAVGPHGREVRHGEQRRNGPGQEVPSMTSPARA